MAIVDELVEEVEGAVGRIDRFVTRVAHPRRASSSISNPLSSMFLKVVAFLREIQEKPVPVQISIGAVAGWSVWFILYSFCI